MDQDTLFQFIFVSGSVAFILLLSVIGKLVISPLFASLTIGGTKFTRKKSGYFYQVNNKKLLENNIDINNLSTTQGISDLARRRKIDWWFEPLHRILIGGKAIWIGKVSKYDNHSIKYDQIKAWSILPNEIHFIAVVPQISIFTKTSNVYEIIIYVESGDMELTNFLKEKISVQPKNSPLITIN